MMKLRSTPNVKRFTNRHNSFLTAAIAAIVLLLPSPVLGKKTPYGLSEPAAFCTTTSKIWDYEILQMLGDVAGRADIIYIPDACHSGGMLQEVYGKYAASACKWDEYARTDAAWGTKFWDALDTGQTYAEAFVSAYTLDVLKLQTPQQYSGLGNNWTIDHRAGDRAILFAGDTNPNFIAEVDNAYLALIANGWHDSDIRRVRGGSRKDLSDAFNEVSGMVKGQRLIIYLNDHGRSTDVIKSRRVENEYQYQIDVSLYRYGDPDLTNDFVYGVTDIYVKVYAHNQAAYSGWKHPIEGLWYHEFCPDKDNDPSIHWFVKDEYKRDPDSWLESGKDYDFGFIHENKPTHNGWYTGTHEYENGALFDTDINDEGHVTGGPLGSGEDVFTMPLTPDADPEQWPGWANGGDGWVLVPVPEPATMTLLVFGGIMLLCWRRKK